MNPFLSVALPLGVFAASAWLTGLVRRYALTRRLLDVPNARSAHAVATPRGGGMAIVITTLAALPLLAWLGAVTWASVWGLAGAGALVAGIGFIDDHHHLSPGWRLPGHFLAAAWALWWLGGVPPVTIAPGVAAPGWLGVSLAAVYFVWVLNLTNFMDGIDGIAGTEAVTVCLGGVLLYLAAAPGSTEWTLPLVLAAAASGFLVWNWPPAQIFMGDAGSGFLGATLSLLSLRSAWIDPTLFWSWGIFLGVFVVDATVTLGRRLLRRERVSEAHSMHAYQHAARRCAAHKPVTLAVAAINVCWLLPLALLVALREMDGLTAALVAYAPLIAGALWLGAGRRV